MKKLSLFSLLVLALSFFVLTTIPKFFENKEQSLISPLPEVLSVSENNQVSTLEQWQPVLSRIFGTLSAESPPKITARSALVYDITQEKILFEKNPEDPMPMASLTKIMTAIIATDNKRTDNEYIVKRSDLVGENSMGLTPGEILTYEELMYGLILVSANDAAETFASNTLGKDAFIQAMNKKAKALGLKNTIYSNASGLEGDGLQQTTAKELLILTRYALKNYSEFKKVVATVEHTIPYSSNHKAFELFNETNLLTSYPGVKGVKDGYTPEAGLCLVTYLDYNGHELIAVILGSQNRRQEMKDLLDYSLRSEGINPPPHQ